MTHVSAAEKRKKRRKEKLLEEERLRVGEEKARRVPAAAHNAHSVNVINDGGRLIFPPGHPATNWPADVQFMVYGSCDDNEPLLPPLPVVHHVDPGPKPRNLFEQPVTALGVPAPPSIPRDFSALRNESTNPWRTIRRRKHPLRPTCREQRPFPQSLAKRPTPPAPKAEILSRPDLPPPPAPTPPIANTPIPPGALASMLPAKTAYGVVHTKLTLACARELPESVLTLQEIFDIGWGPDVNNNQKTLVMELPADQLVFLGVLAAIAAVEPIFATFLHPAIMDFSRGWVAHCQGDQFG
ncbi:hypothetical protein C8R43DRAFT_1041138 [Mycena crocata]|nr:hypothetical protein C8R43DRAFT_1041138 [Mycena crocata]